MWHIYAESAVKHRINNQRFVGLSAELSRCPWLLCLCALQACAGLVLAAIPQVLADLRPCNTGRETRWLGFKVSGTGELEGLRQIACASPAELTDLCVFFSA